MALWGFADWQVDHLRTAMQVVRNQLAAQEAMSAAQGPELQGLDDEQLNALNARLEAQIATQDSRRALLSGESGGATASRRGCVHSASATSTASGSITSRSAPDVELREHLGFDAVTGLRAALPACLAADPALKGGQIDEFIIEKPREGRQRLHGGA